MSINDIYNRKLYENVRHARVILIFILHIRIGYTYIFHSFSRLCVVCSTFYRIFICTPPVPPSSSSSYLHLSLSSRTHTHAQLGSGGRERKILKNSYISLIRLTSIVSFDTLFCIFPSITFPKNTENSPDHINKLSLLFLPESFGVFHDVQQFESHIDWCLWHFFLSFHEIQFLFLVLFYCFFSQFVLIEY